MKIGDKVTFVPSCERDDPFTHDTKLRPENGRAVTGVIVGVNRGHHFYRVEYRIGGNVMHECFKYVPQQRMRKETPYRKGNSTDYLSRKEIG